MASIRNENGKRYAVIGLAVEALHREDASEYMPLVFLHELTHVIAPADHAEHGLEFHAVLDQLIARYNQATGATVKNDYCA